jgi:hypothetical protein
MTRYLLLAALAGLCLNPVLAGVIDNFSSSPQVVTGTFATEGISSVSPADGVWARRTVYADQTAGSNDVTTAQVDTAEGVFRVSTIGLGAGRVWWDNGAGGGFDLSGAPVDLTDGGQNTNLEIAYRADRLTSVNLLVYTDENSSLLYSFALPATGLTPNDPFARRTISLLLPSSVSGNPNLAEVRGLTLSAGFFNGTFELDYIASVPEPGTVALMGSALVGLGLWARRRRKRGTLSQMPISS